jgi:hypothetical protein
VPAWAREPRSGSRYSFSCAVLADNEFWYNPGTNDFYVTGVNAANNRIFNVISNANYSVLDSVLLPDVNAHSIAVDPFNNDVLVPLESNSLLYTSGCVAVFAAVPEPSSLLLALTALLRLAGLGWLRRAAH